MQTHVPDHYRVLGVPIAADAGAIKEAYRKLSRVYHPDRHGGSARATECFQYISGAHSDLSDPAKRAHYDRMLVVRDPLRVMEDAAAGRALDVLDLVVRRLRKAPEALPGARRGRDLRVKSQVPFALAALGGTLLVDVGYDSVCAPCRGQGTVEPERNPVCHVCQGKGTLPLGLRREPGQCGFCGGRGAVLLAPCRDCSGRGVAYVRRQVGVQVPPRTQSGAVLRARAVGEVPALGSEPGDLLIDVQVEPHPLLTADGDDLVARVPVSWAVALQGGAVQVATLEGVEQLTVPAGAGGKTELRIAGRGLPTARGRGNLRIVLAVDVPRGLDGAAAEAVLQACRAIPDEAFAAVSAYQLQVAALSQASKPKGA